MWFDHVIVKNLMIKSEEWNNKVTYYASKHFCRIQPLTRSYLDGMQNIIEYLLIFRILVQRDANEFESQTLSSQMVNKYS
jgi:hypothetical protein